MHQIKWLAPIRISRTYLLLLLLLLPGCPAFAFQHQRCDDTAATRLLCGAKKLSWTLPPPACQIRDPIHTRFQPHHGSITRTVRL